MADKIPWMLDGHTCLLNLTTVFELFSGQVWWSSLFSHAFLVRYFCFELLGLSGMATSNRHRMQMAPVDSHSQRSPQLKKLLNISPMTPYGMAVYLRFICAMCLTKHRSCWVIICPAGSKPTPRHTPFSGCPRWYISIKTIPESRLSLILWTSWLFNPLQVDDLIEISLIIFPNFHLKVS